MALPPSVVKDLARMARGPMGRKREKARSVLRAYLKTKMKAQKRGLSKHNQRSAMSSTKCVVKSSHHNRVKKREGLLTLPRELRDMIYDNVLQEEGTVEVHSELQIPSLLAVNKQIRTETRPIYFLKNSFEIHIKQWEGNLLLAWGLVCGPFEPRLDVCLHKSHNWVHLKMFMREVWATGIPSFRTCSVSSSMIAVLRCALSITMSHAESGWDECDRSLDDLYELLVLYEPEWHYVWHDYE